MVTPGEAAAKSLTSGFTSGIAGKALGKALLQAAESEAVRRGCEQVVLLTHSFQAPKFYERLGYNRKYAIEGRPKGHADIVYVKRLGRENGT